MRERFWRKHRPAVDVETRTVICVVAETITVLTNWTFQDVGGFHNRCFNAVVLRAYFGRDLSSDQECHSWGVVEKDFPLRWYDSSGVAVDEDYSQFNLDCHAGDY